MSQSSLKDNLSSIMNHFFPSYFKKSTSNSETEEHLDQIPQSVHNEVDKEPLSESNSIKYGKNVLWFLFLIALLAVPYFLLTESSNDSSTTATVAADPIQIAEQAVVSNPSLDNYVNLSFQYLNAARWNEGTEASKRALAIDPADLRSKNNLGYGLMKTKKYDEAILLFDDIISKDPNNELAKNNKKFCLAEFEAQQKKIAELEKNYQLSPTKDIAFALSLEYYYANNFKKCVFYSQEVIKADSNNSMAYNNMCAAYNNLNQWKDAEAACKKALEIDAEFELAKNNLKIAQQANLAPLP